MENSVLQWLEYQQNGWMKISPHWEWQCQKEACTESATGQWTRAMDQSWRWLLQVQVHKWSMISAQTTSIPSWLKIGLGVLKKASNFLSWLCASVFSFYFHNAFVIHVWVFQRCKSRIVGCGCTYIRTSTATPKQWMTISISGGCSGYKRCLFNSFA